VAVALCSCKQETPEFHLADLQGLWLENGSKHYVRFTEEQADQTGYFWGCEWDLNDDVTEEDLVFHGNGWFKYNLNKDQLLEIQRMDQDWADIPKIYTVTLLDDKHLTYHPKDYKNEKISFTKQ
jgi:hypothetical protein